jgi:two-component system sensor histidine kinase/response regulator
MPPTKARSARRGADEDAFVFRHAASALWQEDVTALLSLAGKWKKAGVGNVRAHLLRHPSVLQEALAAITTVSVNEAALRLYEADDWRAVASPWDPRCAELYAPAGADIVASVVDGEDGAEVPCRARTASGRPLDLVLRLHPPRPKDGYPWLLINALPTEQGLDDERRLMRTLIDSLPDCIFMKDRHHRFLLANKTLAEMMGAADFAGLVGKTDRDFYHAERAAEFEAEERAVMDRGETRVDKAGAREVRGSTRWFSVIKVPLRDRNGDIIGLVGISRDVTAQKVAEDELSAERTYLTALIDNSFDYIYFKDRQSRFLKTSRAHARLFHLDPAQVVGKSDFDFFSAEHARAAFVDEQRIIQTGEPVVDLEERETWPDRTDTWVTTTKLPLRDAAGTIIGTFGISRDITLRRQIEEKNLLLAAMVEHSNEAIIGIDLEDRVTSWNRGAEKVFGYNAEEREGKPIDSLIAPEGTPPVQSPKEAPSQRGRVRQFETTVTRKDGKQIFVASTLSLIEDSKGRIVGTTLISRDVTEQKALLAQVIRAQRLESLGTLAAGIAHQFNNINAAVKGYLDVAAGEEGVPDSVLSWIREALKGVQRSMEITDRLQSFGSAAHARLEAIDLAEIVPTLLPLFDAQAKEQGVAVRREMAPAVVRASRSTLSFVVTSLVNNSLHALLDRPVRQITLRSRSLEAYCVLEVADTGCGISAENLPRVFTPFFTTKGEWSEPGSPQARVKGVGLSLSVCQSTVAEQGGWIEVESPPGDGATLRVWLPSAAKATE